MNDTGDDKITSSRAHPEVATLASQRAREVKETVSHEAARALENIKAATKEQLERQRLELCNSIGSVKSALRTTSQRLDNPALAPGVERVTEALDSAQRFLDSHEIDDVGVALRRLSLRNPVVFYSGLFAVGFVAGRFLTSTEPYSLDEPELEIDLLEAAPRNERAMISAERAVPYHGPY